MRYLSSLILIGLSAIGCRGMADSHEQGFYSYDRRGVGAFLKAHDLQGNLDWIRRNNAGDKLYVFLYDKADPDNRRIAIVRKDGVSVRVAPGIRAFFNERDEVVAWSADFKKGINFTNQFVLQLPQYSFFDVDPSGKHFVIGEKPSKTWVGNVEQPEISTLVATNFLGRRIFSTKRGLIIAGSVKRAGESASGCL